jgi:hypothetical protein
MGVVFQRRRLRPPRRLMRECCEVRSDISIAQRRVLWINAGMFLAEFGAGLLAHSTALLADSVDMLADALVYGFSSYAGGRGAVWQARAALLKGGSWGRSALSC